VPYGIPGGYLLEALKYYPFLSQSDGRIKGKGNAEFSSPRGGGQSVTGSDHSAKTKVWMGLPTSKQPEQN
jgi:hypothetical protein